MPLADPGGREGVTPPLPPQDKAKSYQARKNWFVLFSLGVTLLWLVIALAFGVSSLLKQKALSISAQEGWVVFFYFLFFSLYFLLVDLPMEFYSGFVLEHRYGLSNQSLGAWAWETAKKSVIVFLIAVLLIEALYLLIRTFEGTWWLFAWIGWFLFSVLLGKIWHLVLLPLFYKTEELKNPELRDRVMQLAERHRLGVQNVYSINLSKTTKKANAAFCGFGKTRRVLLADTLIENFTLDEIETVLAHEIGHYKKHHLWKHLLFGATVSLVVFYIAFECLKIGTVKLGFQGPHDVAAFPLLGLISFFLTLFLLPVGNGFSRFLETEADDFALIATGKKAPFISAMEKLAKINLADPEPHPAVEFLLYTHPSVGKRIQRALTCS